jgi:hypothetical protein
MAEHVHTPFGSRAGQVTALPNVAPGGGVPILFRIDVAAGAAANVDVVMEHKVRVVDVWVIHRGGAGEVGDTLTVQNGTNAITDALDWSGADKAIVRAGELDDAYWELAPGDTLRVAPSDADAGDDLGAGTVCVQAVRIT